MVWWRGDCLTQIHMKPHPLQDLIMLFIISFYYFFHLIISMSQCRPFDNYITNSRVCNGKLLWWVWTSSSTRLCMALKSNSLVKTVQC